MTKFTIPIEPKPQSRPRFSKWGTYEDPKTKVWRNQCTGWIEKNYDGPFYDGPIRVTINFFIKGPKSEYKEPTKRSKPKTIKKWVNYITEKLWHFRKPDLDNLIKAVLDSISKAGYNKVDKQGIVWSDDNVICDLRATKKYSPNPRIEVEIEELG